MSSIGKPGPVLFFAPFGAWKVHHQLDGVLAMALRLRGAEVQAIGCDGIFTKCDVLAWSGTGSQQECANCNASGKSLFSSMDIPLLQLRDFLKSEDWTRAREWAGQLPPEDYSTAAWNGIPIGRWITSSIFSYFRITALGLTRPEVREVHREFLVGGVLTFLAANRICEATAPSHLCLFNGRMAPYRVAFEVARQRALPILCHERGPIDDSFVIFENCTCLSTEPLHQRFETWKTVPLSSSECRSAKEYLLNREFGKGMNYPSFYGYQTQSAKARRLLQIPEQAKVLLVFTSSEYELACNDHYKNLTNQMQLVERLIDVFRKRDEYLVIRHHPYIAGTRKCPPDFDLLNRIYRQMWTAPSNVRVIAPSEQLSSYGLMANADASMSFYSTVGLEATARGIPTACAPESLYADCLFDKITDPDLLGDLVERLFAKSAAITAADLVAPYRFVHTLIAHYPKRFKSFGIKDNFSEDLRLKSPEELQPGNDPELDRLCNHILKGEGLWITPQSEAAQAAGKEERAFLEGELRSLQEQRRKAGEQSALYRAARLKPPVALVSVQLAAQRQSAFSPDQPRSRYANIHRYPCPITAVKNDSVLSAILSIVATLKEPYVVIGGSGIWHDESCVVHAVDALLDDRESKLSGVLYAAMVVHPEKGIRDDLFTERVPTQNFTEAVGLFSALSQAHRWLALGVFRRKALEEMLQRLSSDRAQSASQALYDWFKSPYFLQTRRPLVGILSHLPE